MTPGGNGRRRFGIRARLGAVLRVALVLTVTMGVLSTGANVVGATSSFAVSVDYGSGSSVLPGAKVNLVSTMPVARAGTVSQEIVQTIDPTKLKLTGPSDITYPNGWTLSYSFDGASWTTTEPTTATGSETSWDKVVKVKAAGPIVSQGEANGFQIAEGSASGNPAAVTSASVASVSVGDPHYTFFNASRTLAFFVAHHRLGDILGCTVIATNTTCNGFPMDPGVTSDTWAVGKVINSRIWFPGSTGLACVDIRAVEQSPTTGLPQGCGVYPSIQSPRTNLTGGWASVGEQQIWYIDDVSGSFACFDTGTRQSCGKIRTALAPNISESNQRFYKEGDYLFGSNGGNWRRLVCHRVSTGAPCTGYPKVSAAYEYTKMPVSVPDEGGNVVAVCWGASSQCYDLAGNPYTPPSNFVTNVINVAADVATTIGTRVYTSNRIASGSGKVVCWDVAKNGGAGGPCYGTQNFYSLVNYTVTPDPILENCLWIANDLAPYVKTYDMATNTNGCSSSSLRALTLAGTTAVPRMACASADGRSVIRAWRQLDLTTPSPLDYSSVTLSIGSSMGGAITGWQNRPVTSWPVDLSALDPALTGSSPQFTLKFSGLSDSVTSASVTVTAVGDSPQLCLTPQSTLSCPPVGTGLGFVADLPSPTTSTVMSSGSAMDAGSNVTSMGPVSETVYLGGPGPDQCGGQIRGTASLAGTSTMVVGVTVNLLDSSGNVVRDGSNHPITTTTDASGNYSFANLKPGSYKVSFGANGATAATATQYTDTGAGSTGANTVTATSSTITVVTTQTDVVNVTYPAPLTPTADTSLGAKGAVQTKDLTTNDTPSTGASLTRTSVYLCDQGQSDTACKTAAARTKVVPGVGTYSVSSTTGVMTFTPEATYVGTPPPVNYVISDSSGATASTTYTPTVVPEPALSADSSSGVVGVAQTVSPLANDSAGTGASLTASSVKLCAVGDTAPNCTATSVTVSGQGTYTVDPATGAITFAPEPAFTGTATPVRYSVTDSVGQKASTTYTPTVVGPPTAVADVSSGFQGVAQSRNPLTNDVAGTGGAFTASSVRLCTGAEVAPNCSATSRTVAGQGVYSVDTTTGVITFTPEAAFVGTATAVTYSVTDNVGQKASATYTPSVVGAPTAVADTSVGPQGIAQSVDPLANDTAGSGSTLIPSNVRLCAESDVVPTCTATTKVIPGQGTYSVDTTTGQITFTPDAGYTGTATPVTYSVNDTSGQVDSSTYTPTVLAVPSANPDLSIGVQGVPQLVNVLANDLPSWGSTFAGESVRLCGTGETAPGCTATSITIPAEGTYSVDAPSGEVTFTPLPAFIGTATPMTYQVTDLAAATVSSTITPTVVGASTANPDTSTGAQGDVQAKNVLANDTAGTGATLVASSVRLCDGADVAPNCTATSKTVAGQGTYSVNPTTGEITFTPEPAFTGAAMAVTYSVTDTVGQKGTATYTPTVVPLPTATADTSSGAMGAAQTIDPLANDTAGSGATLVASSVRLCDGADVAPNCTATSVTVSGQGTYSVDPTTGEITFTPEPAFAGTATPVRYSVTDSVGQKASTTSTPTVVPLPTATADASSGPNGTVQTVDPLANDTAGTGATLVASSVRLCDGADVAPNCTATSKTVAGQGTYSVDPTTGAITFAPMPTFAGLATAVTYSVTDTVGQKGTATYTPTVVPLPALVADTSSGAMGAAQTVDPLANDTAGSGATLVASSVRLCDGADVAPNCTATSKTVAGQGTYSVDPTTGAITFTPESAFTGTATAVTYSVTDTASKTGASTLTPTVVPLPTATADTSSGAMGAAQTVDPLANDTAGSGATLVASSVRLCDGADVAPNCTATSKTVAGQGTYSVNPTTGEITFTPEPAFTGIAMAVTYSVTDTVGQKGTATYTPTVVPLPALVADTSSGAMGAAQTIDPLANDTAGSGATLVASSVRLCDGADVAPNCTATSVTVSGQGTYSVNPTTGEITFTPESAFTGTATAVTYSVTDTAGQKAAGSFTPTVVPAPTTSPHGSSDGSGEPQTSDPIDTDNDTDTGTDTGTDTDSAGSGATFDPASVRLCAGTDVVPNCTHRSVTVPGEGRYTVDPSTGRIAFVPEPGFTGRAAGVTYSFTDARGQASSATFTPAVTPPTDPPSGPPTDPSADSPSDTLSDPTQIAQLPLAGTPALSLAIAGVVLLAAGWALHGLSRRTD